MHQLFVADEAGRGLGGEQHFRCLGPRHDVTLHVVDADLGQCLHGSRVFGPLGYGLHTQVSGQVHDRLDDRHVGRVAVHVDNKATVDLEQIGGQLLQVGERGVAGTEIIQCHLRSVTAHGVYEQPGVVQIMERNTLGDFNTQMPGDAPVGCQHGKYILHEFFVVQRCPAQIHADKARVHQAALVGI